MKEEPNTIIKEIFNTVSSEYDTRALRFFPDSAAHLVSALNLRGNEQVIDIATGTGHAALALARHLPQGYVTGVDFSQGMLDQAQRKAALINVQNVEFIKMDMQTMEFKAAQFDVAICAFGIFFVDDMDTQLRHISEMIKSGGTIAISSFQENYLQPLRDVMGKRLADYGVKQPAQTWKRIATEAGCKELFAKAGLRNIRVEQKNMGFFLDNEQEWWDIIWNAGFRRLVNQLQPLDREKFWQDHMQEVTALATKDGIWLDIGVIYTIGIK